MPPLHPKQTSKQASKRDMLFPASHENAVHELQVRRLGVLKAHPSQQTHGAPQETVCLREAKTTRHLLGGTLNQIASA